MRHNTDELPDLPVLTPHPDCEGVDGNDCWEAPTVYRAYPTGKRWQVVYWCDMHKPLDGVTSPLGDALEVL